MARIKRAQIRKTRTKKLFKRSQFRHLLQEHVPVEWRPAGNQGSLSSRSGHTITLVGEYLIAFGGKPIAEIEKRGAPPFAALQEYAPRVR